MNRENVAPGGGEQAHLVAPDIRIEFRTPGDRGDVARLHAAHLAEPIALVAALREHAGYIDHLPLDHDAGLRVGLTITVFVNDAGEEALARLIQHPADWAAGG